VPLLLDRARNDESLDVRQAAVQVLERNLADKPEVIGLLTSLKGQSRAK
jgi:hypothetical protein